MDRVLLSGTPGTLAGRVAAGFCSVRTQPVQEGVAEKSKVLTSISVAGAASLQGPLESVLRDTAGELPS